MFKLSTSHVDVEITKNFWDTMAIKRLHVKRFNAGGRAVPAHAHARYLLFDMSPQERKAHMVMLSQLEMGEHVKHMWRERPFEKPREDLVASGSRHLPAFAQGNALAYWEAAQAYTRKASASRDSSGKPLSAGGVVAKELEISLPRELTREQNQTIIAGWLDTLPPYPLTWAFHEPRTRSGDHPQPHLHLLISPRPDDGKARDARTYFAQPNHGGVPAAQLWTTYTALKQLHQAWEACLRESLRAHGLEHTLQRRHRVPETALDWQEMHQLERLITGKQPTDTPWWGHEYRIPPSQITRWQDETRISARQAAFLAQRGQRQLDWQHEQAQQRVWATSDQLKTTSPWRPLTKVKQQRALGQVERHMETLRRQQRALAQCYLVWINPAHEQALKAYRDQQQKRAQGRGLGRRRARERTQQTGRSGVEVAALDAQMEHGLRQGTQRHGWER